MSDACKRHLCQNLQDELRNTARYGQLEMEVEFSMNERARFAQEKLLSLTARLSASGTVGFIVEAARVVAITTRTATHQVLAGPLEIGELPVGIMQFGTSYSIFRHEVVHSHMGSAAAAVSNRKGNSRGRERKERMKSCDWGCIAKNRTGCHCSCLDISRDRRHGNLLSAFPVVTIARGASFAVLVFFCRYTT